MEDAEELVEIQAKRLEDVLGASVRDELFAHHWRRWERSRLMSRGMISLMAAGGWWAVRSMLLGGLGWFFEPIVIGGVSAARMLERHTLIPDDVLEGLRDGSLLTVLLRGDGERIVANNWRELPVRAMSEGDLRHLVVEHSYQFDAAGRALLVEMSETFHGSLGALFDAVEALVA